MKEVVRRWGYGLMMFKKRGSIACIVLHAVRIYRKKCLLDGIVFINEKLVLSDSLRCRCSVVFGG